MSAIVKKVVAEVTGKYVFDKVAALGPRNPLYEEYTDDSGNAQTKKREIPLGLSKKDQATLAKIRKRAYRLDKGFNLCGLQFGYTFIFGLIPGFGDVLDALLNYFLVLRVAEKNLDLPAGIINHAWFNNIVSVAFGLVPLAGDVVLAAWKANSRNANMFEEYLIKRAEFYIHLPEESRELAQQLDTLGDAIYKEDKGGDSGNNNNSHPKGLFKAAKGIKAGHGLKKSEGVKLREIIKQRLADVQDNA